MTLINDNKRLLKRYTNKKRDIQICELSPNIWFVYLQENKVIWVDLSNNWIQIKNKIDSKRNKPIEDCRICCNEYKSTNRIYCIKCDQEICFSCAVFMTQQNKKIFSCPFCKYVLDEATYYLQNATIRFADGDLCINEL